MSEFATVIARRERWHVNLKRVYRLYRDERVPAAEEAEGPEERGLA